MMPNLDPEADSNGATDCDEFSPAEWLEAIMSTVDGDA